MSRELMEMGYKALKEQVPSEYPNYRSIARQAFDDVNSRVPANISPTPLNSSKFSKEPRTLNNYKNNFFGGVTSKDRKFNSADLGIGYTAFDDRTGTTYDSTGGIEYKGSYQDGRRGSNQPYTRSMTTGDGKTFTGSGRSREFSGAIETLLRRSRR